MCSGDVKSKTKDWKMHMSIPCTGFTFRTISQEVVRTWNIPGVKIDSNCVFHSVRCKHLATRRSSICVSCREAYDIVSKLVEIVCPSDDSDSSIDGDFGSKLTRNSPGSTDEQNFSSYSNEGIASTSCEETSDNAECSAESEEEENDAGPSRKKRRSVARTTLAEKRSARISKRSRNCRSPVGAGTKSKDPIIDLCRQLIRSKNVQAGEGDGSLQCVLCGKAISFITRKRHLSAYKAKRHALTHLPDRYYRCRLCGQKKTSSVHLRLHLLIRHRNQATTDNWKSFEDDETKLERNQQVIMDVIKKCFEEASTRRTGEAVTNDHDYSCGEGPIVVGCHRSDANALGDPIRDYCVQLSRRKQVNGSLACRFCKNTSINVSVTNSDGTIAQRMKTHAFLHSGKHYYKCRMCAFSAVTPVLMTRHVNATHGKNREGDKFDDLSLREENREDIVKAIERCFGEEDQAVSTFDHTPQDPAAFMYLMPNGDLILPENIENYSNNGVANDPTVTSASVQTVPEGCIWTLSQTEELEQMSLVI